jgi:hypothetical protein
VVGLLGVVVVCLIVSWAELVTGQIMIGFLQLPPVVLAALFALALLTKAARRFAPRFALRPGELAVVYCMMLLAAMVSSRGLMEDLVPMLVGINYYANPGNRWEQLFYPYVPAWAVPWQPGLGIHQFPATAFYEGLREGERLPWALWLRPLGLWLILVGAVFAAFLCLAALIRRQWSDNERLAYPLAQLPVDVIREQSGRSFFSNPLTWIGFAIPSLLFGLNGLHNWNPALPSIEVGIGLNRYFPSRPWSDMSFFSAYLSPGSVGFFYLVPSDLLLSFWLFQLLVKAQDVIYSALAFPQLPNPHSHGNGYSFYQCAGGFFVLVIYLGAAALPHLKGVVKRAVSRQGPAGREEMIPYRGAFWGLVLALAVAVIWLHQLGMGVGFAVFVVLVYVFVEAMVVGRGCIEGGLPMAEGVFTPMDISALAIPSVALGPRNLTSVAFFDTLFARDLRGLVFTGFLDGQKLGDEIGVRRRTLLYVFLIALAVAIPVAAATQLWLPYHRAATTMYVWTYQDSNTLLFEENAAYLQGETPQLAGRLVSFVAGGAITAWLGLMRVHYVGWPLHPLGYALSTSWTATVFWFPMLIAWVAKSAIVHYGGMRLYGRMRPLFLGMLFGEFTSAVVWTLIAMAWHVPAPFFPWP